MDNKKIDELNATIVSLQEQLKKVKEERNNLAHNQSAMVNTLNQVIRETRQKAIEETQRAQSLSAELLIKDSQISEWGKIIDEMAHTINSDVFVAVNFLSKSNDVKVVAGAYHVKQIRDLIEQHI